MTSADIQKFTTKMLSEKVFSCAICANLLTIPVIVVETIGNICQNCFETKNVDAELKSVRNMQIELILKELEFPCKFASDGCFQKEMYDDLNQHEISCKFRQVQCLMPEEDCEWTGKLVDLKTHFKEIHSKHVVQAHYDEFSFELNIEKLDEVIKMLVDKNRAFFVKIRKVEDLLLHLLIDGYGREEELKMVLKYEGPNGVHKVEVKGSKFGTDHCTGDKKILLLVIKELTGSNDKITVVIKPKKSQLKDISAVVLKQLECPVCQELMKAPILQCPVGHSVCENCRSKVTECPTCRQAFGAQKIRNYSLEALTLSVPYPCSFNQHGCYSTFLGGEIREHEGTCEYKKYTCVISGCNFLGTYQLLQNHHKLTHGKSLMEGTVSRGTFVPLGNRMNPTTSVLYHFGHENVYETTFQRLADSCSWSVKIMNPYNKKKKYFFVVTVTDPKVKQRKILRSALCSDVEVNNTISSSYESLVSYKGAEDKIGYCCEIFEEESE